MADNFLAKYDPRLGRLKAQSVDSIPQVILLKRKSIRLFPEGGIVGLYYAESINKYVSIPFTEIGISEETVQEETEMSDDVVKSKFSNRVQQLREAKRMEIVSVPLKTIDNAKFDKAISNAMQAEIAYKKGDFAKGDHHARKAESQSKAAVSEENLQELHPETLATYAAFASRDATKAALKDGDAKRWRKREKGVKLALSKYKGETKKDRDSKPKGPAMEPKFEKPKAEKAAEKNPNWKPKAFQWNEETQTMDEVAWIGAALGAAKVGAKAIGIGAGKAAVAVGNQLSGKSKDSADDETKQRAKSADNPDTETIDPTKAKTPEERIKELEKKLKEKETNVNEIFEYSFKDGVVQVTGAVLNDMAEIYGRSSAATKTKIVQSISESAELFKKFADFAVKAKGKIT